jgi:hypothetical protein
MFPDSTVKYSARAIRVIEEATVVDLLNQFRFPDYSQKRPWPWSEFPWFDEWLHQPGTFTKADANIFQQSGINVFALAKSGGRTTAPTKITIQTSHTQ